MKKIIMFTVAAFLPLLASAATLSSTFNIGTLYTIAGATTNVASSCGTAGANSTVSFALLQNNNYTSVSSTMTTDSNGAFSGNVTFPTTYNSGAAILVATCNRTGDTINSPVLTFATLAGNAFGLPGVLPTVGGLYIVSGACGNSNGVGSVQITLVRNSSSYSLGNTNLSPTGTFTSNTIIPTTVTPGLATLRAVCSNGTNFTSEINIGEVAVNAFAFNPSPQQGASTTISGNCSNVTSNANGTASFSVIRNGVISSLAATNDRTTVNGSFASSVFFPNSFGDDPATLVVTCPNGSTFSNVIMLRSPNGQVIIPSTTPVGGVDAGNGPQSNYANILGISVLLGLGLASWFAISSKQSNA